MHAVHLSLRLPAALMLAEAQLHLALVDPGAPSLSYTHAPAVSWAPHALAREDPFRN